MAARFCVNVTYRRNFTPKSSSMRRMEKLEKQEIIYENLPLKCTMCNKFGHVGRECEENDKSPKTDHQGEMLKPKDRAINSPDKTRSQIQSERKARINSKSSHSKMWPKPIPVEKILRRWNLKNKISKSEEWRLWQLEIPGNKEEKEDQFWTNPENCRGRMEKNNCQNSPKNNQKYQKSS